MHLNSTSEPLVYCSACNQELSEEEIALDKDPCFECCSHARRKVIFNVETDVQREMLKEQGYKCLLCHCDFDMQADGKTSFRVPCLDHDHISGKVRGFLCRSCNLGLGYFHENLATMRRAVEYIEKHFEVVRLVEIDRYMQGDEAMVLLASPTGVQFCAPVKMIGRE